MYSSFTGSARPKRQVNLSGRSSNPFAAPGSRAPHTPQNVQNALAHAQQERVLRQQERERPPAAIKIQKAWRGHRVRRQVATECRRQWDTQEQRNQGPESASYYVSEDECLSQLQLLNSFLTPSGEDVMRLHVYAQKYMATMRLDHFQSLQWTFPRLLLAKKVMLILGSDKRDTLPSNMTLDLLILLESLARDVAPNLAKYSYQYFKAVAVFAISEIKGASDILEGPILAMLSPVHEHSRFAYEGFISEGLCDPSFSNVIIHSRQHLTETIDYTCLVDALDYLLDPSTPENLLRSKTHEQLLWLLAQFISFRNTRIAALPDPKYVIIISKLISFLADEISNRVDVPQYPRKSGPPVEALPEFVRSKILTLVDQENVRGLLTNFDIGTRSSDNISEPSEGASALASYALMLLRVFPRRGDEVRMWLYQGSTSRKNDRAHSRLPAIKYFYQAASTTQIFIEIAKDPAAVVDLLKSEQSPNAAHNVHYRDQQWRVILLFLELYSFPLKIMDDEEFLSGSEEPQGQESFTRQSALPLYEVEALTSFLMNLTFSMYWNTSEIAGVENEDTTTSLAAYFGQDVVDARFREDAPKKRHETAVAGVSGLTLDYMKQLVTGVLRMLYERDSRRKFLPRTHWLMTKYFEMDRFISAVVSEEEAKNKIERSYDDYDDRDSSDGNEGPLTSFPILVGTSHTQQLRNTERLKRQQRQASRKKYLESVTPRLEILQNLPFFIPFDTRVQIFREFVSMDQVIRRGTVDPDEWRFAQINSPQAGTIARHRATVRRNNIFEDAYGQFYELGDGLKEPIQIRFVDEFGTVEEGIDGGGVTKEFLTSITAEAFGGADGLDSLFVENEQHLLYPNPSAIEERKEALRRALYKEGSQDWTDNIRELLRRYEFLGRIIGKCLYEGILVDIHFAPFFLLKWALTGGSGAASKESGYRANLNDLRDLDEGLYQGLLQLKNYNGNVEDLSLTFSVDDALRLSPTETKTVSHELQPGGAQTPVTNSNRLIYIARMARYRLQIQSRLQTDAFLRGLGSVVSPSWLSMFNQSELQTLVGGTSTEVNIPDLRSNTQYGGIYAIGDDGLEHKTIHLFWKVMLSLDDTDRKKVLKFVTSTPRAPLLGFGNLNPRFSIRDSGGDQTRLPSTSTCVNLLKLPIYEDEETLRERLLYSVNSGAGFNLS